MSGDLTAAQGVTPQAHLSAYLGVGSLDEVREVEGISIYRGSCRSWFEASEGAEFRFEILAGRKGDETRQVSERSVERRVVFRAIGGREGHRAGAPAGNRRPQSLCHKGPQRVVYLSQRLEFGESNQPLGRLVGACGRSPHVFDERPGCADRLVKDLGVTCSFDSFRGCPEP